MTLSSRRATRLKGRNRQRRGWRRRVSALGDAGQKGFDTRENALDDALDPLGRRMESVGLVEASVADDPVQEEGVEHKPVLLRNLRVQGIEFFGIGAAEIRRRV